MRDGATPAGTPTEPPVDINKLVAQAMKAKLMGDMDKYNQLQAKVEAAQQHSSVGGARASATVEASQLNASAMRRLEAHTSASSSKGKDVHVEIISTVNAQGVAHDMGPGHSAGSMFHKRSKKLGNQFGEGGERQGYFADDKEPTDINELYKMQKQRGVDDMDDTFASNLLKQGKRFKQMDADDEYDEGNAQVAYQYDKADKRANTMKQQQRAKARAISDHKAAARTQDRCQFCFKSGQIPKHLIVAIGIKAYLSLPLRGALVATHALITSVEHEVASVRFDEELWTEVRNFKKCLISMARDAKKEVLFCESVLKLGQQRHTVIECIPVEPRLFADAPMYFKKAIMESDEEWAQHKKVIDTSARGLRASVPKNFPYFHVEFGLDRGFAHVIENEDSWPVHFGRDVIAGMMEMDRNRQNVRDRFEDEKERVKEFAQRWAPHDWTLQLDA